MQVAVKVEDLSKKYGKLLALSHVTFSVAPGEVLGITGPSGSGKTTLLRCLASLERPDSGSIEICANTGNAVPSNKRHPCHLQVGMAFQRAYLWPHMTVIQNLMLAQTVVLGRPEQAARKRAAQLLEELHVSDKKDQLPQVLSGGQMQRVSIARMLAVDPDIILLDEVTAGLDDELVEGLQGIIRHLASTGRTLIVVSHDATFLGEIASKTAVLKNGCLTIDPNNPKIA